MKIKPAALAIVMGMCLLSMYAAPQIGTIDYVEGSTTIMREGKAVAKVGIGSPVYSHDMVKTARNSRISVALAASSGFNGQILIQAESVLYFKTISAESPKTRIELIAGRISAKLAKATSKSEINVASGNATASVRGTTFDVALSPNGSDITSNGEQPTLVICSEGAVSVNDRNKTVQVNQGTAIEKRADTQLRLVSSKVTDPNALFSRWFDAEWEAMKANPARSMTSFSALYQRLYKQFELAYTQLKASPITKKWVEQAEQGVPVDPMDPEVFRELKGIAGNLFDIEKSLFVFERLLYRVDDVITLSKDPAVLNTTVSPGVTVGSLLGNAEASQGKIESAIAYVRYLEALFEERSPGEGLFSGSDSFFNSGAGSLSGEKQ